MIISVLFRNYNKTPNYSVTDSSYSCSFHSDHRSTAESALLLARPYLNEFLVKAHRNYDIAIWSATNINWILAKLVELHIVPSTIAQSLGYVKRSSDATSVQSTLVSFILDATDMISVFLPDLGVKEVKPLAVIWENHPQWGPHNTIMIDDIKRNFVMNPQSGLVIKGYREAHVNRSRDNELRRLGQYLDLLAENKVDFSTLNHNHWIKYVKDNRKTKSSGRQNNDTSVEPRPLLENSEQITETPSNVCEEEKGDTSDALDNESG